MFIRFLYTRSDFSIFSRRLVRLFRSAKIFSSRTEKTKFLTLQMNSVDVQPSTDALREAASSLTDASSLAKNRRQRLSSTKSEYLFVWVIV